MPELIAAYPHAKIILTQRPPDAWHKSVTDTILRFFTPPSPIVALLRALDPTPRISPRLLQLIFDGVFGGRDRFVTHGKETYVQMHDEVRRLVPEDRRLDYRLGEGWERLCAFLGEDVPEGDFPRVNETAEFGERVMIMNRQALGRVARRVRWWVGGVVVPVVGVAWFVYVGGA